MTLDELLARVAERSLKVANLFQFQSPATGEWRWQANLTDGQAVWEFGRGPTAGAALETALEATRFKPVGRRAPPPPKPAALVLDPGEEDDIRV
jgi:hypothetical protein